MWVKQDGNMVNMEESKRERERRDKELWVRELGTGWLWWCVMEEEKKMRKKTWCLLKESLPLGVLC